MVCGFGGGLAPQRGVDGVSGLCAGCSGPHQIAASHPDSVARHGGGKLGYHVTIIRTEAGGVSPLSKSEIDEAVGQSTGLSFDGKSVFRRGEFFLAYADGELWLKNPAAQDLEDMLAMAGRLAARVRGDDLETYRSVTETYSHPDDAKLLADQQRELTALKATTRRRQWLLNGAIIGFFLLLITIFQSMGWLD